MEQKEIDKLMIKQVIQSVLAEEPSHSVDLLQRELSPLDFDEQLSEFCDKYDLGNWFYEAMTLNEVDIISELVGIFRHKFQDEQEANKEESLIATALKRAQS